MINWIVSMATCVACVSTVRGKRMFYLSRVNFIFNINLCYQYYTTYNITNHLYYKLYYQVIDFRIGATKENLRKLKSCVMT